MRKATEDTRFKKDVDTLEGGGEARTLLLHVQELLVNFGVEIGFHDSFRGFHQTIQAP